MNPIACPCALESKVSLDPMAVGSIGADRKVFNSAKFSDVIEQFGFGWNGRLNIHLSNPPVCTGGRWAF